MNRQRTARGHYTSAALRHGMRDQYAVQRSYGRVIVELRHDGSNAYAWRTSISIEKDGMTSVTDTAYRTLDEARRAFRRLVRNHP